MPIDEANSISGSAWGVWAALATFAKWETFHGQPIRSKEGTCIPRIEVLAARAHCSKWTVLRALEELESAGYVRKESRYSERRTPGSGLGRQRSNGYTLYPNGNAPKEEDEPITADEIRASLMAADWYNSLADGNSIPG